MKQGRYEDFEGDVCRPCWVQFFGFFFEYLEDSFSFQEGTGREFQCVVVSIFIDVVGGGAADRGQWLAVLWGVLGLGKVFLVPF